MDARAGSGEAVRVSGKIETSLHLMPPPAQTSRLAGSNKIIAVNAEGTSMKKPLLSIEEPEPKKAVRADRPPTKGSQRSSTAISSRSLTPPMLLKSRAES